MAEAPRQRAAADVEVPEIDVLTEIADAEVAESLAGETEIELAPADVTSQDNDQ